MDAKHYLKNHAYQNVPLTFDEAYALGLSALAGCDGDPLAQIQSIAVLSALHNCATYAWQWNKLDSRRHGHQLPKNAAEQIAGVCTALFQKDLAVSKFGWLKPNVPYAMDNCGMGGDLVITANVSTVAALIASVAGIPMCKHGSPANADNGHHGSSDFVSLLGINTYATKNEIESCVEAENFGYAEALDIRYKRIHQQTHAVAKLPHMNDIIGPITNPLCPSIMTRKVLGVNHLVSPRLVAETYQILNEHRVTDLQHGLFIRGFTDNHRYEGMDEVSICVGGTQVAELKDGMISEYDLKASDFGLTSVSATAISPPPGLSKGNFSLRLLKGEITGPPLEMILANAAILFYLAGFSQNLKVCYEQAKEIQALGLAWEKVQRIAKRLPQKNDS